MSVHMKKHPISENSEIIHHAGHYYQIPRQVLKKYYLMLNSSEKYVNPSEVFTHVNQKYTKPGALLRGLRVRENLSQVAMAKKIQVTQSDISQMENGKRLIGRKIAQRLAKLFNVDYRIFLA